MQQATHTVQAIRWVVPECGMCARWAGCCQPAPEVQRGDSCLFRCLTAGQLEEHAAPT